MDKTMWLGLRGERVANTPRSVESINGVYSEAGPLCLVKKIYQIDMAKSLQIFQSLNIRLTDMYGPLYIGCALWLYWHIFNVCKRRMDDPYGFHFIYPPSVALWPL